jgi:heme-degrading monooxygenase HmoA
MSEMIVEQAYLDFKPGEGHYYVEMWPEFKALLLSLPGGIAARLLRNQAKPDSFVCCMQWESKAAKDVFIADPRLKAWAAEFWKHVAHETIDYFDEVG